MKEVFLENPEIVEAAVSGVDRKRARRWSSILLVSAAAGTVSGLTGLTLGAVYYLGFAGANAVDRTGNLMIIAAFALLMLAAHALDRLNEIKRRSRKR